MHLLFFQELVSIAPNERNWRGICIALLVIVAILALIFLFIVLLSKPKLGPFNPGTKFTADDVIKSEFKSSSFNGSWISGMFWNYIYCIYTYNYICLTSSKPAPLWLSFAQIHQKIAGNLLSKNV